MVFQMQSMLEDFEYRGYWWPADKSDISVPGVLKWSALGGAALELFSTFESGVDALVLMTQPIYPLTICGVAIDDNKKITLFNALHSSRSSIFPGISTSVYRHGYVLVGNAHVPARDSRFDYVDIRITNFETWLGINPFETTIRRTKTNEGFSPLSEVTAKFTPPKIDEIQLSQTQMDVSFNWRFNHKLPTELGMEWEHRVDIRLSPTSPQTVDWFIDHISSLRDWLAVMSNHPVFIDAIQLNQYPDKETESDDPVSASLFFVTSHQKNHEHIPRHEMLITAPMLDGDGVSSSLRLWLEGITFLQPLQELYLGLQYFSHQFLEVQLLTLTQALEGYHRRRYGGEYLSANEYQALRDHLYAQIPSSVDNDLAQRLRSSIKWGYQFSLRTRLRELMGGIGEDDGRMLPEFLLRGLPEGLRNLVAEDTSRFINLTIDTRNYFAHRDEESVTDIARGEDLYWLVESLKVWCSILLLREMEVPDRLIAERWGQKRVQRRRH